MSEGLKVSETHVNNLKLQLLTLGRLVLGAAAVVAAQAGVERAAETLVVERGERVEADARLVVKLAAVQDVAATHLAL